MVLPAPKATPKKKGASASASSTPVKKSPSTATVRHTDPLPARKTRAKRSTLTNDDDGDFGDDGADERHVDEGLAPLSPTGGDLSFDEEPATASSQKKKKTTQVKLEDMGASKKRKAFVFLVFFSMVLVSDSHVCV